MFRAKVTRMLALAGFAPAGKPGYANRQERFQYTRDSMEALRLVVAIAILSVSASWIAYGQKRELPPDPCARRGFAPASQAAGKRVVRVMQQNMDAGTDLGYIFTATDPASLLKATAMTYLEVVASDIPTREALLADEIAVQQPDLIALQEATLWRTGPFEQPPATTVLYDQLQLLLTELENRGLHYAPVAVNSLLDAEAPTPLGFDLRMTDRDAMLARTDLPPSEFALSNIQTGIYQAEFVLGNPVLGSIPVPRGWMTVDVQVGAATFRFANTHLESPPAPTDIQVAQASELVGILSGTTLPVMLLGDFNANADPGLDHFPTTDLIVAAGFVDTWHALRPFEAGFTWPLHGEDPYTPIGKPNQRMDLIFLRGLGAVGIRRIGRPTQGVWPSDHTGVVASVPMPE
jgi:endonuclease/exonuclease/phosphatase family metal-dependent hydrolase